MNICRSCNSHQLKRIMSYGDMPLANGLLNLPTDDEQLFPLELWFCEKCYLVQITETVDPELLFQDYAYFSSCSDTVVQNAKELVDSVMKSYNPTTVVEIASNDGYLLQHYPEGVSITGIDPAENVAKIAQEKGINTIVDFFGLRLSEQMDIKANIIHANNVLAHVADLNDFVAGVANLLSENGTFIVEVPYLGDLIEYTLFDTVYHEHLCYFSVLSMMSLFGRHGLFINHVEHLAVHGGSIRVYASKVKGASTPTQGLMSYEKMNGMYSFQYYRSFSKRARELKYDIKIQMSKLKKKSVAGVGASAKGNVLLNYCNIDLDFIGDNTEKKQGLFTPGKRIPIVPMDEIVKRQPDYVMILAWNHADEIMAKLDGYNGKFIIPLPKVRIV